MYAHTKHGFVEADAWDGQLTPCNEQNRHLMQALGLAGELGLSGKIVVVRARDRETIAGVLASIGLVGPILESPEGWDYEWRTYLPAEHFAEFLAGVALSLDYRNFKHTCQDHDPKQYPLALAIWNAAYSKAVR